MVKVLVFSRCYQMVELTLEMVICLSVGVAQGACPEAELHAAQQVRGNCKVSYYSFWQDPGFYYYF